jgi:uncharacterized protein YndB with AHSA1/START domain
MSLELAGNDTLVHEIQIKAPARRIFAALINPAELLEWWHAEGKFQVTHVDCDPQPGGKWRMQVRGRSGVISSVSGEYRRIDRPRLLEFTWIREQEERAETLVRWELREENGLTTVRVTHSGLDSQYLRERNSGWPLILTLLQAHIESPPRRS